MENNNKLKLAGKTELFSGALMLIILFVLAPTIISLDWSSPVTKVVAGLFLSIILYATFLFIKFSDRMKANIQKINNLNFILLGLTGLMLLIGFLGYFSEIYVAASLINYAGFFGIITRIVEPGDAAFQKLILRIIRFTSLGLFTTFAGIIAVAIWYFFNGKTGKAGQISG